MSAANYIEIYWGSVSDETTVEEADHIEFSTPEALQDYIDNLNKSGKPYYLFKRVENGE